AFAGSFASVVVTEVRCQPAFADRDILALALAVAFDLILVDLAHGEVLRFRVGEVPAGDGGGREHGVVLGEEHATATGLVVVGRGIEQFEQRGLFGVIRAGRVTRGRADALVLLADQRVVVQLLVLGVTPVLLAHAFMQPFGAGFGKAVGQGLDHDRVVIIALGLVGLGHFLGTDAGGGDEAADVVSHTAFFRRDEVGQRQVRLAVRLDGLLAQVVQGGERLAVLSVNLDIVVLHLIGRPEIGRAHV